jgi:hypothetical protein
VTKCCCPSAKCRKMVLSLSQTSARTALHALDLLDCINDLPISIRPPWMLGMPVASLMEINLRKTFWCESLLERDKAAIVRSALNVPDAI